MRVILMILFVIVSTACALKTTLNNNPGGSNTTLSQWQRQSIDTVINRLGSPNQMATLTNGNSYYIYTTLNYQLYPNSRSAPVYSTATRGYAQIPAQETSYANYSIVKCSLIFEVNASRIIISTATKGYSCDSTLTYLNKP